MERIAIHPQNITHLARFILTLQTTAFPKEQQNEWLKNKRHIEETLEEFLEPKALLPGETIIDHMDRQLRLLVTCVRHTLAQLPTTHNA